MTIDKVSTWVSDTSRLSCESFEQVARHAAEDICQDVLSQFAMDSTAHRFVRVVPDRKGRTSGPVPPTPSLPGFLFCREGKPGSPGHKTLVAQYSGWFGAPHADALLRLIGPAGLVGLVEGVRERLQYVLKFVLPASLKTAAGRGRNKNIVK
jgi:hypothetical protein